tara:strand:- start:805 stop:2589 length:1785 start_codon:yes stop_codon:yes gene_type:complete
MVQLKLSKVAKGTGILLQQILDMRESLKLMKEGLDHDYSGNSYNDKLKNSYSTFQIRRSAYDKQLKKLVSEYTPSEYDDVKNLIKGDFDKVEDQMAVSNTHSPPNYESVAPQSWRSFSPDELKMLLKKDYKINKVGGAKFYKKNDKTDEYLTTLRNIIDADPVEELKVEFQDEATTIEPPPQPEGSIPIYYDGTQTDDEIRSMSTEKQDLIDELMTVYYEQENAEKEYSPEYIFLKTDARFAGIDFESVEELVLLPTYRRQMSMEDEDADPVPTTDPDAPYLPVGADDVDPQLVTPADLGDGTNPEYTLGDGAVLNAGLAPDGTQNEADPYTATVDPSNVNLNQVNSENVDKIVKTGVLENFTGFGTVPEVVVEGASRTSPEIPTTPQDAMNMETQNEIKEQKERNKKDIERLKSEIKGLHNTFDALIPELKQKDHQTRYLLAMKSTDKKIVMKHHTEMLEKLRIYFSGGSGNNLKVGIVVPLDQYMSSFFSNVNNNEGEISNIKKTSEIKQVEQHSKGLGGGNTIAQTINYQRGGMSAFKQQAVANHKVASTMIKTKRGKIVRPVQKVDEPYNHVLNRGGNARRSTGLKIKSR